VTLLHTLIAHTLHTSAPLHTHNIHLKDPSQNLTPPLYHLGNAIVTPESHTSSTVADKVVSDSSTTVFSPLLAYTAVDHAPSVSVTETNGACDNKQDILMQS